MDHFSADQQAHLRHRVATLSHATRLRLTTAMKEGSFGICVTCGDELPFDLLDARPEQAMCSDCVEDLQAERAGRRMGVCGIKTP